MKSSIYSYHHIQPELLPHFGFKIHISATIKNYKEISQIVTPFLEENHIAYKYIKKDADVYHSFSVNETMAESGKYFTIYPKNKENFLILLEKLYQLIPSYMEGIYIMSDRPYRDSKVIFYRFGTIKWDMVYVKGGHPTLIGPNQEEWQDYQKPYFDLPSWIEDIQEEDIIQKSYLSEHYSVSSILKADNGGNVYLGQSLSTGQNVIIKEARPHILYFDKIYKSDLRQMEFTNLQEQTPYTPQTIEHVKEWIHDYYIYQKISGLHFYEYAKQYTVFSYQSEKEEDLEKNLAKFKQFLRLTKRLLDLVHYFHDKNIILHDIHPDNLIVTETEEIFFIDFEHAYPYEEKPLTGIYHDIALMKWNELDGKIADCHKVANLLLYVLAKLQIVEDAKAECRILNLLLEQYGISTNFTDLILYLFSDNACITNALHIFSKIEAKLSDYNYSLVDDTSFSEKNDTSPTFIQRVKQLTTISADLKNSIQNKDFNYFTYLIQEEKQLGLEGRLGQLLLLREDNLSQEWSEMEINHILGNLVIKEEASFLPLDEIRLSPYFNNGSAGLIKALLYCDCVKYKKQILSLARGLFFEFAQFSNYDNGMLGVADTLLDVYELENNPDYLYYVEKLLLNTSFYLAEDKVKLEDFYPVWKRYLEVQSCFNS